MVRFPLLQIQICGRYKDMNDFGIAGWLAGWDGGMVGKGGDLRREVLGGGRGSSQEGGV